MVSMALKAMKTLVCSSACMFFSRVSIPFAKKVKSAEGQQFIWSKLLENTLR